MSDNRNESIGPWLLVVGVCIDLGVGLLTGNEVHSFWVGLVVFIVLVRLRDIQRMIEK